jgi:hypothetical protein
MMLAIMILIITISNLHEYLASCQVPSPLQFLSDNAIRLRWNHFQIIDDLVYPSFLNEEGIKSPPLLGGHAILRLDSGQRCSLL